MKKNKTSIWVRYLLKLAIFAACLVGLLFCLYLIVNKDSKKISTWNRVKDLPAVNLFKFFGIKWNLILLVVIFITGILYKWPFFELLARRRERREFIKFCQGVHMAMVSADVGRGKTLLLSILAREMPHGIKKVGFVSNVPDAQLLSYSDLNFDLPVPKIESYRIPKYYFVDELNFLIEGTSVYENRIYHKGVAWLMQICRHHRMRVWMSATRDNHVWVSVRQMANYYVKLGGLEPLMDIFGYQFYIQRVRFYSQEWELKAEFNIEINNLDFELYDSYWLKDTSYFRPTIEGLAEEGRLKREQKQKERELAKKLELEQKQVYERRKRKKIKELVEVLEMVKLKMSNKQLNTEITKTSEKEQIKEKTEERKIETQQTDKKRKGGLNLKEYLEDWNKEQKTD